MDARLSDLVLQLDQVWTEEIRPQWRPEAERILMKLHAAPTVIISGPHNTAKSGCLVPTLVELALAQGFEPRVVHLGLPDDTSPLTQCQELIILDEMGFVHPQTQGSNEMKRFIRYLSEGSGRVKLIAIATARNRKIRRYLRRWFQRSLPLSYRQSVAHSLETRLVDPGSAVRIFTLLGAGEELQRFVKMPENRALWMPGYLGCLYQIVHQRLRDGKPMLRTVEDLREIFKNESDNPRYGLLYSGAGHPGSYSSSLLVEELLISLGWSPRSVRWIGIPYAD